MRGRRTALFSRGTAVSVRGFFLPTDRLRKLAHVVGWIYQLLLWSILVMGISHAAYSRFIRSETPGKPPATGILEPTKTSLIPAYTIR